MKRQKASYTARCPTCLYEHDFNSRKESAEALREWRAPAVLISKIARQINPENPIAAAVMHELWKLLNDALPIIEAEADRRADAFFGQSEPYWSEMSELAHKIEKIIRKAMRRN